MSSYFSNQNGLLTVITSGYNNDNGKAVLLLFRKDDKIPSSPFKTYTAKISNKRAVPEIQNLAFDNYAIILHHDGNGNGKIDHLMGLPNEQLGYSNNWTLGFTTGMPTFSKLKFQFSAIKHTQEIGITYKSNKK
jgi:uncharacterized protein (DUF2141 family)